MYFSGISLEIRHRWSNDNLEGAYVIDLESWFLPKAIHDDGD